MKKILIGLVLCTAFSAQAKNVLTINAGTLDGDLGDSLTMVGFSGFQAYGQGRIGFSYGLDFSVGSMESAQIEVDQFAVSSNIGMTYGVTDELYLIPSIGTTYYKLDVTDGRRSETGSELGYNYGVDMMYLMDNGFSFGVGLKKHEIIEELAYTQFNAKIGYSF